MKKLILEMKKVKPGIYKTLKDKSEEIENYKKSKECIDFIYSHLNKVELNEPYTSTKIIIK